jgi:hypothetical protein
VGVKGNNISRGNCRLQHAHPVILEQKRVVVRSGHKRIQRIRPGRAFGKFRILWVAHVLSSELVALFKLRHRRRESAWRDLGKRLLAQFRRQDLNSPWALIADLLQAAHKSFHVELALSA